MDTGHWQREKTKFTPPSARKGKKCVNPAEDRMSEELRETEGSEEATERKRAKHHCKPPVKKTTGKRERDDGETDRKTFSSVMDTPDQMDNARTVLIEMEKLRASIDEDRRRNQSKHTETTDRKKNIIQERGTEDTDEEEDEEPYQLGQWMVQCSNAQCGKWRTLDKDTDPSMLPDNWTCNQSSDPVLSSCAAPEVVYTQAKWAYSSLVPGSLVWAKQNGYPWWPAIVERDPDVQNHLMFRQKSDVTPWKCHVTYMGTPVSRAWLPIIRVKTYRDLSEEKVIHSAAGGMRRKLQEAVSMARAAVSLTLQMRLNSFGFYRRWTDCNSSEDSDVAEVLGLFFAESEVQTELCSISDKDVKDVKKRTPVNKQTPADMFAPVENTEDDEDEEDIHCQSER